MTVWPRKKVPPIGIKWHRAILFLATLGMLAALIVPVSHEPAAGVLARPGLLVAALVTAALYVAAVLGTGILVLPSLAAREAGPASILSVAAVLILSIPLAGTFAALASRFPDAGGVATFVRLALGDTAARAAGYWFYFGVGFGAPVVAALGGEYLVAAIGADRSLVPYIGIGFLALTLALGAFGLRVSGSVQLVLTALLVVVVVLVVVEVSGVAVVMCNEKAFSQPLLVFRLLLVTRRVQLPLASSPLKALSESSGFQDPV